MPSPTLHFSQATLQHTNLIMQMEVQGFAPGNREAQAVYEQRMAAFPQGSLLAYIGSECVGCFFSEIWHFTPLPAADNSSLVNPLGFWGS